MAGNNDFSKVGLVALLICDLFVDRSRVLFVVALLLLETTTELLVPGSYLGNNKVSVGPRLVTPERIASEIFLSEERPARN